MTRARALGFMAALMAINGRLHNAECYVTEMLSWCAIDAMLDRGKN